jgi:hypothetical protein
VGVDLCHSGSAGKGEVISHSLRNGPEARGTLEASEELSGRSTN